MQVSYNVERDRFSITDMTGGEAGAVAGALEFAIGEKKKQNMYVVTCEKGYLKIVESVAKQLVAINFTNRR